MYGKAGSISARVRRQGREIVLELEKGECVTSVISSPTMSIAFTKCRGDPGYKSLADHKPPASLFIYGRLADLLSLSGERLVEEAEKLVREVLG